MKLSKKLFLAGTAVLLASLVGCTMQLGGGAIKVAAGNTSATVDYTNEDTSNVFRSMELTPQKHYGSDVVITVHPNDGSRTDGNGMMGYVFNEEEKDGLYNFCIAGFGVLKNGTPRIYVSCYKNIDPENLNAENFGAGTAKNSDDNYINANTAAEREIRQLDPAENVTKTNCKVDEDTYKVGIRVKQMADGTYKVYYFGYDKITNDNKINVENVENDVTAEQNACLFKTEINPALINQTTKTQGYLGFYCNVYGGETLSGEWKVSGYDHEDIPVEE